MASNRQSEEFPHLTIDERFAESRIADLCNEFIEKGSDMDLRELIGDRQYLVAFIPAQSRFADIPRAVESTVFAEAFGQARDEVTATYNRYDPISTFVSIMDVSTDSPKTAGVARISSYDPEIGFKDRDDFIGDYPENPWLKSIKDQYFKSGESYEPETAWQRLQERAGVELDLYDSLDIPTHAVMKEFRGKHGAMDGTSMLVFHACMRYALATNKSNLLAIFDEKPFENLQQFGEPFDTYQGIGAELYAGPYPAIPAFCKLARAETRIRGHDKEVGRAFVDGYMLNQLAVLPGEYMPKYSNKAVGLPEA